MIPVRTRPRTTLRCTLLEMDGGCLMQSDMGDDRDKPTPDWTRPQEPRIHRAARKGDLGALEALLAEGANINERADLEHDNGPHLKGLTALMVAARSIDGADTDTLHWLVEHGADIHARSDGGNTAAWYAAGHGGRWEFHARAVTPDHAERLRYLLDLGLDPNECNFIGRSLLTEACEAGDPARVALLLERGVSAVVMGPQSLRPDGAAHVSRMLADHGLTHRADGPVGSANSFQIPLFCAARSGSAECVRLLLEKGADPNGRDSSGSTALMAAGSAEVVRLLLEAGADRDATDAYGNDALEAILEDSCDSGACGPARFEVARALVEAGADIARVDRYGKNRLASAAFGHHADAVEFLLRLGARADARDTEGGTALHSMCWQGEYQDEDVNRACERIIRALVAAGVPIDAVDEDGQTPMHEAAGGDWGNPTAIRTLLDLGAKVDPEDHDANTPLMVAARSGEVACIKLLCEAGADPRKKNGEGLTALDEAESHLESWRDIVASGPDMSMAEMEKQVNEEISRDLGEPVDDSSTDLSQLLDEQTQRHHSALQEAEEAAELLRRAAVRLK